MHRRSDLPVALVFAAALLAPALAWRIDPGGWTALEAENRNPAPFPGAPRDTAAVQRFPRSFELWQADTLGLRAPLLRLNNLFVLDAWRKLPSPTLLLGRDGWIFYTGEDSRRLWRGLYPIPRDYAANWVAALRSREAWFARRGIAYLYAVAPNKEALYPDRLPAGDEALGPTLLDLLDAELEAQPELPLLDLRAALSAERAHDRPAEGDFVYHPLGTHWTERAGWAAAEAIAARLEQLHPGLAPAPGPARADCRLEELADSGADSWAPSLRLSDVCRQRAWSFRPRAPRAEACSAEADSLSTRETWFERPDGAGPALFLLHDSFGPWLRAPLAERCAELATHWDDDMALERITEQRPRVVVELRTERRLREPPVWLDDPLESLAPERCAALRELERLPAEPDSIAGIAADSGSRIEPVAGGAGVRVLSPDGKARVRLSGWRSGPGGRLVLHLVLHAPAATEATLWYQTRAEPRFHPRRHNVLRLAPGRNELFLRLPEAGIEGALLFQPGAAPGEYRIELCEGRSGT